MLGQDVKGPLVCKSDLMFLSKAVWLNSVLSTSLILQVASWLLQWWISQCLFSIITPLYEVKKNEACQTHKEGNQHTIKFLLFLWHQVAQKHQPKKLKNEKLKSKPSKVRVLHFTIGGLRSTTWWMMIRGYRVAPGGVLRDSKWLELWSDVHCTSLHRTLSSHTYNTHRLFFIYIHVLIFYNACDIMPSSGNIH